MSSVELQLGPWSVSRRHWRDLKHIWGRNRVPPTCVYLSDIWHQSKSVRWNSRSPVELDWYNLDFYHYCIWHSANIIWKNRSVMYSSHCKYFVHLNSEIDAQRSSNRVKKSPKVNVPISLLERSPRLSVESILDIYLSRKIRRHSSSSDILTILGKCDDFQHDAKFAEDLQTKFVAHFSVFIHFGRSSLPDRGFQQWLDKSYY